MTQLECQQIFALLSEYLDKELPPVLCEQISGHIESCPACVEFLRSLNKTVEFCRQLKLAEMPGPLPDHIVESLRSLYEKQLPK